MLSRGQHFIYEIFAPERVENNGHCWACIQEGWESVPGVPDNQFRWRINNTLRDDLPDLDTTLCPGIRFPIYLERAAFLPRSGLLLLRGKKRNCLRSIFARYIRRILSVSSGWLLPPSLLIDGVERLENSTKKKKNRKHETLSLAATNRDRFDAPDYGLVVVYSINKAAQPPYSNLAPPRDNGNEKNENQCWALVNEDEAVRALQFLPVEPREDAPWLSATLTE